MNKKIIIGIDEVGRGPLAGPVTVAALVLPTNYRGRYRDSKKLSAKRRKEYFIRLRQASDITFATASVFPATIDRINITKAANLAATRALRRVCELMSLSVNESKNPPTQVTVLLDGGLYLNRNGLSTTRYPLRRSFSEASTLHAKTCVGGDEKFNAIKLASIVAKVKRDALMDRYHQKYPVYGFDQHKGYGTRQHYRALKKHGPSKIHRLTFLKNLLGYKVLSINSKSKFQSASWRTK